MSVPANEMPPPAVTALNMRSPLHGCLRVFNHHDGVGSARDHATGGNRRREATLNGGGRNYPGVNLFFNEQDGTWLCF